MAHYEGETDDFSLSDLIEPLSQMHKLKDPRPVKEKIVSHFIQNDHNLLLNDFFVPSDSENRIQKIKTSLHNSNNLASISMKSSQAVTPMENTQEIKLNLNSPDISSKKNKVLLTTENYKKLEEYVELQIEASMKSSPRSWSRASPGLKQVDMDIIRRDIDRVFGIKKEQEEKMPKELGKMMTKVRRSIDKLHRKNKGFLDVTGPLN